jgi:hypothetical protein
MDKHNYIQYNSYASKGKHITGISTMKEASMSFVGIPQACESIAIDLEKLGAKLRQHAQAIRRPDLPPANHEEQVRSLGRKAIKDLEELFAMMDGKTKGDNR